MNNQFLITWYELTCDYSTMLSYISKRYPRYVISREVTKYSQLTHYHALVSTDNPKLSKIATERAYFRRKIPKINKINFNIKGIDNWQKAHDYVIKDGDVLTDYKPPTPTYKEFISL